SEVTLPYAERKVYANDAVRLASWERIRVDDVLAVYPAAALIQRRLLKLRRPHEGVLLLARDVRAGKVLRPQWLPFRSSKGVVLPVRQHRQPEHGPVLPLGLHQFQDAPGNVPLGPAGGHN